MARLVVYTCENCGKKVEEIFNDTEEQPKSLEAACGCGGKLTKNNNDNLKDNCHRWSYLDRGGF